MTDEALPALPQPPAGDLPAPSSGQRLPILPETLHRGNFGPAVRWHAGRHWHLARFHGLRLPWYAVLAAWCTGAGAARVTGRLVAWWHAADFYRLEHEAAADGLVADHLRLHRQGRQTRKVRGIILAACLAGAVYMGVAVTEYARWAWAPLGVVLIVLLARHGRPQGRPIVPSAVVKPEYEPPTPQVITRALGALGIPAIADVIKNGPGIAFVSDVHRDGEGWSADLDLPFGVTAAMIVQRREQLASGLRRPLSATWPEPVPHEHEGRLRLWVGFHDMSKMKPRPWPLLKAGTGDVFAGVPFGTDPRGRVITVPVFEANWIIGAAPGQGKTSAVRAIACGAALDTVADLWVHEHAGKGDLEPLAQVCYRYVSGLDDESVAYAAKSLRMLRAELGRRSESLKSVDKAERPDGKVTRELAGRRGLKLRPVVAVFDEVHNVFMHPDYGSQAADDAAYVARLGRAYGIILILATQRPSAETVPTAVSGNMVMRYCLKVPGQPENDAILGTGSYKAGYRASSFRGGTDAGMGWLRSDADPQVVRTFYLTLPATEKIAARARALRETAGVLSGHALGLDDGEQPRSFAADVISVFGSEQKLWCATIATRLAESIPGVYADVTAGAVASQLRGLGVPVKNVREPGRNPNLGAELADVEEAAGDR